MDSISFPFDKLNGDCVILLARYCEDNQYLGQPDFRPIWEDLNRRKAVVFVHPTPTVVEIVD
jgi:hypothetical protein